MSTTQPVYPLSQAYGELGPYLVDVVTKVCNRVRLCRWSRGALCNHHCIRYSCLGEVS